MELLYALVLVLLGLYNWRITDKLVDAEIALEEYNNIILQMAEELESLGSPNVKIHHNEQH
jgi:beta-mannanase